MPRARLLALLPAALCVLLPLLDLAWNLAHLNVGLPDFYGLALPARALALHGAWPQTPYFPALYPLLLVPFGLAGSVLTGGYALSCGGLMLALFAVRRLWLVLSRDVPARWGGPAARPAGSQTQPYTGAALILLAWLMPVWRVVAGSPSVDALYTGLGLWFITAAVAAWQLTRPRARAAGPAAALQAASPVVAASGPAARAPAGIPIVVILWLAAFLLPLLRYHAVLLVVPVALVLALRIRGRWTALAIVKSGLLAVVFNYLGYVIAYGEPLPAAAVLQVRCGIEFAQRLHYATPDALWVDYADFAARGRSASLLADYTAGQLAQHVARNYAMFLRQPAIALALLWTAGLLMLLRSKPAAPLMPAGSGLLAAWMALYCLSLSPAYYTARSALLPALAGLALAMALAQHAGRRWQLGTLLLLLLGYGAGSRFAVHDFRERRRAAAAAVAIEQAKVRSTTSNAADLPGPLVADTSNNPWCLPYPHASASGSWLDDPAIPGVLTEGWPRAVPNG